MPAGGYLRSTIPGFEYLPGLLVLSTIAVGARGIANVLPVGNALILAVASGVVLGNTLGTPESIAPGISLHKLLLETGIVLLGVSLTIEQIIRAGPLIIFLVTCVIGFGLLYVEFLSRVAFGLSEKTGSLLAAGSSICGVSAVVAVASSIDATEEQIAYAAATILLFDAITIIAFPVFGSFLGLSGKVFGIWSGLSMFSTGPVAAAGFTYSEIAGRWATITKLVRNSFIGFAAIIYSIVYASDREGNLSPASSVRRLWRQFPKFLVGFLLLVGITNFGILSSSQIASIDLASEWLFLLAFAGLGFGIRLPEMRDAGLRPILVVSLHLLTISVLTLTLTVVVV